MADNPFDDPDVQAQSGGGGGMPPPVPQNVYGDANAYDEPVAASSVQVDMGNAAQAAQVAMQYVPQEQQKEIAVAAGSAMANQAANKVQADYNESARTQSDQHAAPPPPTFCVNLVNWFPIRLFAFIAGVCLLVAPILDFLFFSPTFIQGFIYLYLMGFGVVTVMVEAPTWTLTRVFQLKFFFWFRLLSRMWGRAWFYLFISILCYAGVETDDSGIFVPVLGGYLTGISVLSFIFSRMAGKKFARIREFIAAGSEGDELEGRFMRKFDELDMGGTPGTIGSPEIVAVAKQAGRNVSNSERHAIQTFLDESCNGHVSKEDWMKQFVTQYQEKKGGFKQRFL